MSWDTLFETTKDLPAWVLRLNRVPFLHIAYIVGVGYMYHTLLYYSHLSPSFNNKALNYCSGNRIENMKRRLVSWMLELEWNKA